MLNGVQPASELMGQSANFSRKTVELMERSKEGRLVKVFTRGRMHLGIERKFGRPEPEAHVFFSRWLVAT